MLKSFSNPYFLIHSCSLQALITCKYHLERIDHLEKSTQIRGVHPDAIVGCVDLAIRYQSQLVQPHHRHCAVGGCSGQLADANYGQHNKASSLGGVRWVASVYLVGFDSMLLIWPLEFYIVRDRRLHFINAQFSVPCEHTSHNNERQ